MAKASRGPPLMPFYLRTHNNTCIVCMLEKSRDKWENFGFLNLLRVLLVQSRSLHSEQCSPQAKGNYKDWEWVEPAATSRLWLHLIPTSKKIRSEGILGQYPFRISMSNWTAAGSVHFR